MIDSPIHLWRLLKTKEDLVNDKSLEIFMDSVDTYMNGCRCIEDINYDIMINNYNDIKNGDVTELLKIFGCDRINLK
jgi:hypothetical protein